MKDMVAFVYNTDIGSSDEPIAMMTLRSGMLRFHAPKDSPYKGKIGVMNGNALSLEADEAEEMFYDYTGKWNNQFSSCSSMEMTGKDARIAEKYIRTWA
jgi:hypothetical protein